MGPAMKTILPAHILAVCLLNAAPARAQQVVDSTFDTSVARPAYTRGTDPVVAIDEAHYNFHTRSGRYLTIARPRSRRPRAAIRGSPGATPSTAYPPPRRAGGWSVCPSRWAGDG